MDSWIGRSRPIHWETAVLPQSKMAASGPAISDPDGISCVLVSWGGVSRWYCYRVGAGTVLCRGVPSSATPEATWAYAGRRTEWSRQCCHARHDLSRLPCLQNKPKTRPNFLDENFSVHLLLPLYLCPISEVLYKLPCIYQAAFTMFLDLSKLHLKTSNWGATFHNWGAVFHGRKI